MSAPTTTPSASDEPPADDEAPPYADAPASADASEGDEQADGSAVADDPAVEGAAPDAVVSERAVRLRRLWVASAAAAAVAALVATGVGISLAQREPVEPPIAVPAPTIEPSAPSAPVEVPADEPVVEPVVEADEPDMPFRPVFPSARPVRIHATCDELVPAAAGLGFTDAMLLPVIDDETAMYAQAGRVDCVWKAPWVEEPWRDAMTLFVIPAGPSPHFPEYLRDEPWPCAWSEHWGVWGCSGGIAVPIAAHIGLTLDPALSEAEANAAFRRILDTTRDAISATRIDPPFSTPRTVAKGALRAVPFDAIAPAFGLTRDYVAPLPLPQEVISGHTWENAEAEGNAWGDGTGSWNAGDGMWVSARLIPRAAWAIHDLVQAGWEPVVVPGLADAVRGRYNTCGAVGHDLLCVSTWDVDLPRYGQGVAALVAALR